MYDIERTAYGMRIELGGHVTASEMQSFREETADIVADLDEGFGVLADMRGTSLGDGAGELLAETMAQTDRQGFGRAAVAIDSSILDLQQEQLEEDASVDDGRRVIDATAIDDWETQALEWVRHGIEPEG
jgi:hypothetical protein